MVLAAGVRWMPRDKDAGSGLGALRRPSLRFVVVAVTQVAYEVEGWGVGELVVADDRVVWHELPWPRAGRPATWKRPESSAIRSHSSAGAIAASSSRRSSESAIALEVE